ncbi:MAG: hypothetical protein AAGC62_06400, partial [Pseudomonadota bacterium]
LRPNRSVEHSPRKKLWKPFQPSRRRQWATFCFTASDQSAKARAKDEERWSATPTALEQIAASF